MGETAIEWADYTFNPWIGCTKVSPGCKNCYADVLDERRFSKVNAFGAVRHWGPGAPRHVTSDAYWKQPLRWNETARKAGRRMRVFCASLADVFDAEAPPGALTRLWALIRLTPNLDWLLLTKRPERIAESLPPDWGHGYPNVWLGTSVEDQQRADERVPILLRVPARVRFLSCEPLLGEVNLKEWVRRWTYSKENARQVEREGWAAGPPVSLNESVDWVIVGGESGPGARPMHPAWARSLRDQCATAGMAFFFKQHGEWVQADAEQSPVCDETCKGIEHFDAEDWPVMLKVGKKHAGRHLDGRTHDEFPEVTRLA